MWVFAQYFWEHLSWLGQPQVQPLKKRQIQAVIDVYKRQLLDRPIHDVDIASSSYPEETKAIFDRTVDVGIEHGTVLVLENGQEYEITTFRTEDVYVDYRRPSSVSFVRSLEEDLKRRDFTVNAFALNEKGEIAVSYTHLKVAPIKRAMIITNQSEPQRLKVLKEKTEEIGRAHV